MSGAFFPSQQDIGSMSLPRHEYEGPVQEAIKLQRSQAAAALGRIWTEKKRDAACRNLETARKAWSAKRKAKLKQDMKCQ
jgi:hypothetical protein